MLCQGKAQVASLGRADLLLEFEVHVAAPVLEKAARLFLTMAELDMVSETEKPQ
jgi:hypothetical protein